MLRHLNNEVIVHKSGVDGYTEVLLCTYLVWMDMLRLLTSEIIEHIWFGLISLGIADSALHITGVDGYVETLNQSALMWIDGDC